MKATSRAMILAAGRGERMRPLTDHTPKPLLAVRGKPLIEWHLEAIARAGIKQVVINLAWLSERIRAALGEGHQFGLEIVYSDEGASALETGGGIFHALPLLGPEPFLLVNGDTFSNLDFSSLVLESGALAHLVLVPNPPQHPGGDFALDAGHVMADGDPRYTYSGIGLYHPELFAGCVAGRFPLLPLLQRAMAARRLRGHVFDGLWSDVGTVARLQELEGG